MATPVQAAVDAEQRRHADRMATLQQEVDALVAVLAEQQQNFQELVDRVARLRVARAEYMSARAQGTLKQVRFNTGSDAVDAMLHAIQDKVTTLHATGSADNVLSRLSESARGAAAQLAAGASAPGKASPSPVRLTNIAVITRPDVRGVRAWATRQMNSTPAFANEVHQRTPAWEPYRYDHGAKGLALVPGLHAIPNKRFHRVNVCLLRERSLLERADERTLDLIRLTTILKTTDKATGQPLSDPTRAAATIQAVCERWVRRFIETLQEKVRTSAPWNQPGTANDELSGAIDMLLYSVVPHVAVRALQSPAGHEASSLLQVDVSLSTPLHVSAVDPLLALLWRPTEREYISKAVLLPIATALGSALGHGVDVSHYAEIGLAFFSALLSIAQAHNLVSPDGAQPARSTPPPQPHDIRERLYHILNALALAQSSIDVDVAVPDALVERSQYAATTASAKRQLSRWLQALLRNVTSPTPYTIPPLNDPGAIDVAVKVLRVPTEFLEILNRTFSSNQRLPSTSRNSILDLVVTPQSKISLGLKLYSELVLEIYRPFSRASGIVVGAENGAQGRPKAPAGVPVTELAEDTVKANEAVAAQAAAWMTALQQAETSASEALPPSATAALSQLAEDAGRSELLKELYQELSSLSPAVDIQGHYASYLDILLPFGLAQGVPEDNRKALLYVHVSAL